MEDQIPTTPGGHAPVLLAETIEALDPRPGQTLLDCTAGLGGHSAAIAGALGATGRVVLVDLDPGNLALAEANVSGIDEAPGVISIHGSFAQAPRTLAERGIRVDLVLADLGFASTQVDDPARGFSFRGDGPLDMRLDPTGPITCQELVNTLDEDDLTRIIRDFGEERFARRVARKLVEARLAGPILTTSHLAAIVRRAVPKAPNQRIDPATRTFQGLRIAVNDELGALEGLLGAIEREAVRQGDDRKWLAPIARIAIIAFHSLEDRPVKRCFKRLTDAGHAERVGRGPTTASEAECDANRRARSAKLRAIRLTR
jgi:16S rRNA (cytosine1402-N4)-methyltransferase